MQDAARDIAGNFSDQSSMRFPSSRVDAFFSKYDSLRSFQNDLNTFYTTRNYAFAWYTENGLTEQASNLYARLESLPDYLQPLVASQPRYTERRFQDEISMFPAVFRGFHVNDWTSWWHVFFYRFVDPESRMGPRANYRDRLAHARATVLPSGATIYWSPAPVSGATRARASAE